MREDILITENFPESVYQKQIIVIDTFKHGKKYYYNLDFNLIKHNIIRKHLQEFFYWSSNNCSQTAIYPYYNTFNCIIDYLNEDYVNDNIEKIDFNFKNEAYAWWKNKYDKLPTEYHKHFIVTFSSFMYSLNKSKYNEYDLNIWDIRNLGLKINQKPTKEIYRLDFTFLKYDGFIKPVKEYIYKCIKSYEKITTTKVRLLSLRLFIKTLINEGLYDFSNLERKYIKKYINFQIVMTIIWRLSNKNKIHLGLEY